MDIWNHSGWLARGVIIMLFLMLIGTIVVSIERNFVFNKRRKLSMDVAASVVAPLTDGNVTDALLVVQNEDFEESSAILLKAGLAELSTAPTASESATPRALWTRPSVKSLRARRDDHPRNRWVHGTVRRSIRNYIWCYQRVRRYGYRRVRTLRDFRRYFEALLPPVWVSVLRLSVFGRSTTSTYALKKSQTNCLSK